MPNCKNDSTPADEVVWLDDTGSGREPQAEQTLSIESVARMFGVSRLTLRYYEWRGLIRRRHSVDGVRVYGWADCERLAFIIKCRKAGLPLHDVIKIVESTDDDAVAAMARRGQELCMVHVDRLEQRRRVIDDALAELSHLYALLTSKLVGDNTSHRD